MNEKKIKPLEEECIRAVESSDPENIYTYTPGLLCLPDGRLLLTVDFGGPGAKSLPAGVEFDMAYFGSVFISDDHGVTWRHVHDYPAMHARPFFAGESIYILGQHEDLVIIRSDDLGTTWSAPSFLTSGEHWHQSACNVWYDKGCVYLVMECVMPGGTVGWPVDTVAPVLMRAPVDADLTRRESWTFASKLVFQDTVDARSLDWFGVPFYPQLDHVQYYPAPKRGCASMGWLETNVVKIMDPAHYWYDPTGRTFHMFARAHTGGTGYCAMLKAVEQSDGSIETMLETAPSGKKWVLLPMPGGQMRFHILYDEQTALYWLLSSQATDSMTRAELLPPDRYNLPNNERHRMQLHFSKNCVDWCFAGLVAIGETALCSRHYASMVIEGEDLVVASRSGDLRAKSAHNGNFISVHRIKNFRELVY